MAVTKLRIKLLERDEPQYMIAAALRMSPSRVSEYALGKRPIPAHHLIALCAFFHCNPTDIIGEADVDLHVS